ncbi:MAG: hypothetical protein AAF823_06055 [Planctomycetota bacterium]
MRKQLSDSVLPSQSRRLHATALGRLALLGSVMVSSAASAQLQYDVYQINVANNSALGLHTFEFHIGGIYNNPQIDFSLYEYASFSQQYGLSFFTGPEQPLVMFNGIPGGSTTESLGAQVAFLHDAWIQPGTTREVARIAVPLGTNPLLLPTWADWFGGGGDRLLPEETELGFQHLETVLGPTPAVPADPSTGYDLYRVSLTNDTQQDAQAFSVAIDGVINDPSLNFAVDDLAGQLLPEALSLFTHPVSAGHYVPSDLNDEDTLAVDSLYFGRGAAGPLIPNASMDIAWISVPIGTDPYSLSTSTQLYTSRNGFEDGGVLDFAGTGGLNFTYVATVIPEPTALGLAAFGLGLMATRRSA